MDDHRVFVDRTGEATSGIWIDGVCGVELRVGDHLWLDDACTGPHVCVTRIEVYGRSLESIDSGMSGRLWISPREISARVRERDFLWADPRMARK